MNDSLKYNKEIKVFTNANQYKDTIGLQNIKIHTLSMECLPNQGIFQLKEKEMRLYDRAIEDIVGEIYTNPEIPQNINAVVVVNYNSEYTFVSRSENQTTLRSTDIVAKSALKITLEYFLTQVE